MSCPSETRLQAFVGGELGADEIDELSDHLDACDTCRTLVGLLQPVCLDDETPADNVGRYILRRVLGRGGMGIVYEAVDPELHRDVALKVLRSDLGAAQKRLLDEAEAMAKLSHPNVVAIYDVGRTGDRVFIVMALVRGISLRHWLARKERTIAEIIEVFVQCANGLCAAHEAGLVHRDFKPENVFVADDGRVLVGDFGLAMPLDAVALAGEGSLAYMAPEQRSGTKVDARADQYSFCVALDEALRGRSAQGRSTPRWLAKILARGTKPTPQERFPSMSVLGGELRAGHTRSLRRRRALALGLAGAALALGSMVYVRAHAPPKPELCGRGEAAIVSAWTPDVQQRTEAAMRDTKSPLWQGTWQRTQRVLDSYVEGWKQLQTRACAPSEYRSSVVDLKMTCLLQRVDMLDAVLESLAHVDAAMLERVPAMLQLLPRVNACDDVRAIEQAPPQPAPDQRPAVDDVRVQLARATSSIAGGRYDDGLTWAEAAWREANATAYLPVLAEAYLGVGTAHGRLGHQKECEQALEHSVSSASAGQAPLIAIRAWIQLMHFIGLEGRRYDDGYRYSEYARVALESVPGAFELAVERLSWTRAMLLDQKRFDEALGMSRQELALVELRFGDNHQMSAVANDGLAGVLAGQCRARDALAPQEKACRILEAELGEQHPQLALCLGNLAGLHASLGEHEQAVALKRRGLAMFVGLPGHPNHVAMAHRNLVRSLLELNHLGAAKTELDAAAALSVRDSDAISVLLLRGELQLRTGDRKGARRSHEDAVARTLSAEPMRRLDPLVALAATNLASGRFALAVAGAREASTIAVSVFGATSCRTSESLRLTADALVASGRTSDALPLANEALAALRDAQVDPLVRARVDFTLAASLAPANRDRARKLAIAALDVVASSHRDDALAAHIERWLAQNP